MTLRKTRRTCGLTLGLIASWGWGPARADEPRSVDVDASAQPAVVELESSTELSGDESLPTEKVQERYPSRALKLERYVLQDEEGNYVNHGPFVHWDEDGRVIGRGAHRFGRREGTWTRWFSVEETEANFGASVALGFTAPFTSQVEYAAGEMHGTWTIVDAAKRRVSACEFETGRRNGMSVWWYPDGKKFREAEYRLGELDGALCEWNAAGRVVKEDKYFDGYRHGLKLEYYATGELKSECETLFAKQTVQAEDDWWNGTSTVTVVGRVGRDQRHGKYVAWNRSGQKILEGRYVDDHPDGKFTWWFDNGNRAIEGYYIDGRQDGLWTWWHENGQKEICGEYAHGREQGEWRRWGADGRVADTAIIGTSRTATFQSPIVVDMQPTSAPPPVPHRLMPSPADNEQPAPPKLAAPPAPLRRASFEASSPTPTIEIVPVETAAQADEAPQASKKSPAVRAATRRE